MLLIALSFGLMYNFDCIFIYANTQNYIFFWWTMKRKTSKINDNIVEDQITSANISQSIDEDSPVAEELSIAEDAGSEVSIAENSVAEASVEEEIATFTDTETGLTAQEVASRVAEGKINGVQTIKTKSVPQILRENIFTYFNFVFLMFAVILLFFTILDFKTVDGKTTMVTNFDAKGLGNLGFVPLIIGNCVVGVYQNLRSKRTMDKLSLLSAPKATVVRDGEESEIKIEDIVLDDITILSTGRQICADGIIVDGTIEVNESLITGEPDPIVKNPGDKVMSGSFVVSGKAKCQVIHIGSENFAMKITAGAKYVKRPSSEIWRSLMFVTQFMSIAIIPIGIALFLIKYLAQDGELSETAVKTIGTLIGMMPSGLVALATTVFCVSIIRLSKHKTNAQDLYCIETLARVDVLCLDKTGTITEGTMEVNDIECVDGDIEQIKGLLKDFTTALESDDATSNAIKDYVADCEVTRQCTSTVPFSSQRKYSGATLDGVSYVLGAPEFVFKELDDEKKAKIAQMAEQGYRVLVLGKSSACFDGNNLPDGLTLVAYIYITDKIRAEAPDTLKYFKEQGVTVKIISGDSPATVRTVAMRAGLDDCDNIIDMSTVKDDEIPEIAEKYTIFGRVLPHQKLALVKALKAKGHTVAMTGDGVNDVLALKEADCSVAMASGSDAAKNVSSLVLLDSNFASMPKVVEEGRRSINNLECSASLFLVKTLYNTMLAVLFMIVPFGLPFEPRNLTVISSVTIGMPAIALALEPNKERISGHFLPKVLAHSLPGSLTVVLGAIAIMITSNFILKDLSKEQVQGMYILLTTFVGLAYLLKVSLPLTWIHTINILAMVACFIVFHFIEVDIPLPNSEVFHFSTAEFYGLTKDYTPEMAYALLIIGAILVGALIGFIYLTKGLVNKEDGKFIQFLRKIKVS